MKTFEITKSANGNYVIINHHAKPAKEVHVYNSNGKLLNDKLEQKAFDHIRFCAGSSNVKGETMQEAVLSHINAEKRWEAEKQARTEAETPGAYEVDLKVIPNEGCFYYVTISVLANNSDEAKQAACAKYWESPKWNTIQVVASSTNFLN